MSDDREKSGQTVARRRDRPLARGGRALARQRNVPPAPPPSAAPPAEANPFPWPVALQPTEILFESRRKRRRGFLLRLGLFSGLPTILTLYYMLFVASPRYVSEFEITYQAFQPQQNPVSTGLVQTFLGTSQGSTVDLSQIVYEYIRSETLLKKLDAELHLREYYSSPKVDYLSRMNPKTNIAMFMRYYLWYVSVSQGMGGYLTVDVQAFDPDFALAVAKAIIKHCDDMVDALTARARQDEVRFAETEVKRAEDRVRKARMAMTIFQNVHGDLNPPGSANQLGGIVGTLEGELATTRAQLSTLIAVAPHSPQVVATKAQIASLEGQLKLERNRLANNTGGSPYSKILDEYSALIIEQEFAKTDYMSAQQGLEVARVDAAQKQTYLIDFAPPYKPDRQKIEFALFYTLTAMIISLVLFGIGSLVGGAMRDQAGM
jgi:capsular polysaccharide transport system permease protein